VMQWNSRDHFVLGEDGAHCNSEICLYVSVN
jgi:hypothetical protein